MSTNIGVALRYAVDLLGINVTYTQGTTTKTFKVGYKAADVNDREIINAYGINTKVVTILAKDGIAPLKFDVIDVGEERYIVQGSIPLRDVDTSIIGYKLYAAGD